MPAWSVAEWRARIGSSWCALGRPFKTRSPFRGQTPQTKLTPGQVVAILAMLVVVIGVNLGLRVVVATRQYRAFEGLILGCLFDSLRGMDAHLNQLPLFFISNLTCILGVYTLHFIWRNLNVLSGRMKRSPILLVFVIAALLDAVERTSASVISFQLLLSGDVEENPGPDIDYETIDATPLDEDDLFDIIGEIVSLESKYYDIGIGLRLKGDALRGIESSSSQTPREALRKVISAWLDKKYNVAKFGSPTWRWLVTVVDSEVGGNDHDLAKKIASNHQAQESGRPETAKEEVKGQEDGLTVEDIREVLDLTWEYRANWKFIGTELNIKQGDIEAIASNHHKVEDCLREMLCGWLRCVNPRPTRSALSKVLRSERVAHNIATDRRPEAASEDKFGVYADYLKSLYKAKQLDTLCEEDSWPPPVTNQVFNLAMITTEKVQRGKIDDDYVRDTITGKVDDILQKKKPIELGGIFGEAKKGEPQKVLFEGAPGCGKSTLSLYICHEWTAGRLFQQYSHVVLVKLRDPIVRSATKLAHLLPQRDESMSLELEREITLQDGRCILFIFDGWDELPSNVPSYKLIKQILDNAKLHKCSVIITSRPISSSSLYQLVNIRIEIIGFTRIQLNKYFIACLENDTENVEKLQQRIKDNPVVAGSCYLPLNASILVHLFKCDDNNLPTTLFGIFSTLICHCIYRHLKKNKGSEVPAIKSLDHLPKDVEDPFKGICRLAYTNIKEETIVFELERGFNTLSLLQGVESFVKGGMPSRSYSFLHLSIQELLAAVHMAREMEPAEQVEQFRQLFGSPRFSAVFRYYSAVTKLKTPGIDEIVNQVVQKCIDDSEATSLIEHSSASGTKSVATSIFGHKPQPLLLSILHCLFEAQDHGLCQSVAEKLQQKLNLSRNNLDPADCLSIGYFLTHCKQCEVNLQLCSIGDDECKALFKHGETYDLQTLNLYGNSIGDEGAMAVAAAMKTAINLRVLGLNDNSIGPEGAMAVAAAMKTATNLQELYLSLNSIGPEGAMAVAAAMKTATNLQVLRLHNNSISPEGAMAVAAAMKTAINLRVLRLSFNSIGPEGAMAVAAAMKTAINLRVLSIGYNDIGEEGEAAIRAAAKETGTKIYLDESDSDEESLSDSDEEYPSKNPQPSESEFLPDEIKELCTQFATYFAENFVIISSNLP